MSVNNQFIALQTRTKLSNGDLAMWLGVDIDTIAKYRRGDSIVPKRTLDTVNKIIQFLKV